MTPSLAWTPHGFDDWRRHFPSTPFAQPAGELDWTARFIACWERPALRLPRDTVVVLVSGLYSEWLPRCHRDAARALRGAGYRVLRIPVRSSRGVMTQATHIGATLRAHLSDGQRFIALTHSKGGIDTLAALAADPALCERCDGIALVQPPVGPALVVDEILGWGPAEAMSTTPGTRSPATQAPATPASTCPTTSTSPTPRTERPWHDRIGRPLLRSRWLADGTRDISSRRDPRVATMLANLPHGLHSVHAISWSIERSSRFDTFHARLDARRPGCAHDGQFYLEDQALAGLPQICLPRLDHGQPVLGGLGFDSGRFWLALADLLHASRPTSAGEPYRSNEVDFEAGDAGIRASS
ncbi:hypothetical protein [Paraburkholderia megapolitana]|uniref:Uncharacterized protein n=1 Tax=Paraburkholderia megapolitana TaxID=420953 RepID=A0A1I3FRL6_9BURK|nr:hypothetical protein [Paraburkholderia megapolitana]SFI13732.1 hypothetical protein SAMN05192543_10280 [Paraburkholderia megapolitana]